jgi:hypothetical protein
MPPFKPHTTAAASTTAANASLSCTSPAIASYCPRGRPVPHPAMRANCPSSSWQPHHPLPTANEDQQEQAVFSPTGVVPPLSFPHICKPPSGSRATPTPYPATRANCPSSSWQPHHLLSTANEDQQEQAVFSPTGVASPLSFPRLCKPPSVPRHSPYPTDILPPAPAPPLATADATPAAPRIAICRSSPLPAALRVVGEGRRLSPAPPPAIVGRISNGYSTSCACTAPSYCRRYGCTAYCDLPLLPTACCSPGGRRRSPAISCPPLLL